METNDTYNFYDQSKLVRIDHVDNFNEFIHLAQNQASQDDVCEADFEVVDDEDSDAEEKVKEGAKEEVAKEEVAKVTAIPKELSTPQGIAWLHKMQDAGVLEYIDRAPIPAHCHLIESEPLTFLQVDCNLVQSVPLAHIFYNIIPLLVFLPYNTCISLSILTSPDYSVVFIFCMYCSNSSGVMRILRGFVPSSPPTIPASHN